MRFLRAGIWVACVASVVLFTPEAARGGDDEDILGGDSVATDFDVFVRTDLAVTWRVEVSSFVYDSSSDEVPEGTPEPAAGQTLFAYLLENTGNDLPTDIAVTDFSIGNPDSLPLLAFDAATADPDGLDEGDRSDPRNFFENTQSVAYNWQDVPFPPPATMELLIGQWSVVYFLVDGTYTDQNGSVIAGGISDGHTILGPMIPEPATLLVCLVRVGALTMTGRRKSRTAV